MSANTQKNPLTIHISLLTTLLVSALLVGLLSACSSQQTIHSFTPETAPSDQAAVYVYRPLSTTNAFYSPDLYVNDEFRYSIKTSRKTRLILAAGETTFELAPDKNYSGVTTLSLDLKAGTTYFLRVDTSLKIKNTTNYQPYDRSFSLVTVTGEQATDEIGRCCYSGSKGVDDAEQAEPGTDQTEEADSGFSVDKTQNPFSH